MQKYADTHTSTHYEVYGFICVMDGGVEEPILFCGWGVCIIINGGLNKFPILLGDLTSSVDSVYITGLVLV
jgi:hypothetical protein